jgi:multidrug efflux pump subunit AcrB
MSFNLSALAVRHRSVTLFLIIVVALAGLFAFNKLGRAEDPPITGKTLTIVSTWPGATAQQMQDLVAEPLEKRLQELKTYDHADTFTRPGLAFTTLTLKDDTRGAELTEEFYQVRKKMLDQAPLLPQGVVGPFVNDEYSDVTFALFALKAKGLPPRLLAREAETLRQRLLHVPGVKKVNILGEQAEKIFVDFSYARLATLGVAPRDIFSALTSQNLITPAGAIETQGPQVVVRLDGALDDLEKIKSTPIVVRGRTLRLGDIAEVKRGYEDPPTYLIRNQGEPAIELGIVMQDA